MGLDRVGCRQYRWWWWSWSIERCKKSYVSSECETGARCPRSFWWNRWKVDNIEICPVDTDLGNRRNKQGIAAGYNEEGNMVVHADECVGDILREGYVDENCNLVINEEACTRKCSDGACFPNEPNFPAVEGDVVIDCE